MALQTGSPAIHSGVTAYFDPPTNSQPITTDQAGYVRPTPPSIGSLEYVTTPTVTGISPIDGPESGGTLVTITGTGFTGATEVEFGITAATSFTDISGTSITANSPAGTGTVDVTVATNIGTSATSPADHFTYVAAPTVSSLSPADGPTAGGTTVTITGTNFTGATEVEFGTNAATDLVVVNSTTITVHSPADSAGAVDVTVVTAGGTSATSPADQFTYVAAPVVSSLNPTDGPAAGGTLVTITGTNFTGATEVEFGATAATDLIVLSDTSITVQSPAGTAGVVDVTVITVGGTSATSAADHFTYVGVPAITINGGPLALGSTAPGTPGSPQSYTVSGANLTADLLITPPSGVELSDDDGIIWATSLSITPDGGAVASTTVEARIDASAPTGTISGAIANTSSGAIEQDVAVTGTVKQPSQSGAIVSSAPQTFYGEDVTLTATFMATNSGSSPMTGTVAFFDGSTYLGTAPLVANGSASISAGTSAPALPPPTVSGQASLATTELTVGGHIITAVYSGDANYSTATSETPVSVQVAQATSTTILTAATTVQGTTLTATVVITSPGSPPIVGTVAFYDGSTLLGTEPVANGVASLNVTSLATRHALLRRRLHGRWNEPRRARRRWSSPPPTRRSRRWSATDSTPSPPTCS